MFADQAKEREHPDALVDGLSRPTAPHLEMSFGRGNNGFPAISMTQHAANKFAQWLSAKTGEGPTACRPRPSGITRAGRAPQPPLPRSTRGLCLVREELGPARFCRWHLSHDRHEEGKRLGPVRHARQRHGVDPGSVRAVHGGAGENPWVTSTAPYPHAVRGGSWHDDEPAVGCTVRVPSDASWKRQDPQLPRASGT